eukprot:3474304-Pyramimonas_sp.AAC.1
MGAALSEPCTMTDLNHYVWKCDTVRDFATHAGWMNENVKRPFRKIVTGMLHVDDLVAFSRV